MKKIIFMSLMALLPMMSNPAMAQLGSKSEFTISAGAGTPNEKNIGEALGEAFGTAFVKSISAFITMGQVDLTDNTKKDESIGPAINLQYLYRVAPKVKAGVALSYQHASTKLQAADNSGNYHDIAKATTDYFTVMPVVKAMWMEKEHIGLYSKAAAGVCIASNSAKMVNGAKEKTPGELTDQGHALCLPGFCRRFRGWLQEFPLFRRTRLRFPRLRTDWRKHHFLKSRACI